MKYLWSVEGGFYLLELEVNISGAYKQTKVYNYTYTFWLESRLQIILWIYMVYLWTKMMKCDVELEFVHLFMELQSYVLSNRCPKSVLLVKLLSACMFVQRIPQIQAIYRNAFHDFSGGRKLMSFSANFWVHRTLHRCTAGRLHSAPKQKFWVNRTIDCD